MKLHVLLEHLTTELALSVPCHVKHARLECTVVDQAYLNPLVHVHPVTFASMGRLTELHFRFQRVTCVHLDIIALRALHPQYLVQKAHFNQNLAVFHCWIAFHVLLAFLVIQQDLLMSQKCAFPDITAKVVLFHQHPLMELQVIYVQKATTVHWDLHSLFRALMGLSPTILELKVVMIAQKDFTVV